jgi:hypothetical protein
MARQTVIRCDVCRKPCQEIVAKLLFVPLAPRRQAHSNYTHLADVGECCGGGEDNDKKILKLLNFRRRQTKEQYRSRAKKAS